MIALVVNIVSFAVAIYLSIIGKPRKVQVVVWLLTLLITAGNIYVYIQKQEKKPYFDLITPHISSIDALNIVKSSYEQELKGYDLIDVIGSYYICLRKPDTIFHRFPEWVFLFRSKFDNHLVEYKVSDNRIPNHPFVGDIKKMLRGYWQKRESMTDRNTVEIKGGYTTYYIVAKKDIRDGSSFTKSYNNFLVVFDKHGRNLITSAGRGPDDNIGEAIDGITSQVLARAQVADRPTSYVTQWTEIVDPNKMRTLVIRKADFEGNDFYQSLSPIKNWEIDIDEAIYIAAKKGGKGFPLGKERIGGPGVARLYNGKRYNIEGSYWKLPYKIGIRPILIDASTGELYAMNNKGEYSKKWGKDFAITSE